MIDYGEFPARLAGRRDRWSLLREVIDEWRIVVKSEPQSEFSADEIAYAEARLGLRLPLALTEWYALPFRRHKLWGQFGRPTLDPFEGDGIDWLGRWGGFVRVYSETQDCCWWGFRAADAGMPDPPIYNGMDLELNLDFRPPHLLEREECWIQQSNSLSEWVLQDTFFCALPRDVGRYARYTPVTQDQAARLLESFKPLGFARQPWFQATLLGGPNAVVQVWPVNSHQAWERVTAARPHPTIIPTAAWARYWEPATEGPLALGVFCRDAGTLSHFTARAAELQLDLERD